MKVSIERLRRWLLVGAGLLVVIIAGFLTYAHYRAHRFLTDLPRKLGADVRQEANGFTWSQTVKGRTVFTVHAAKAIQHQDSQYTLHDVAITVYGNTGGQGQPQGHQRVDHISGKEFELNQTTGLVRAMGEVHLDLEAPSKDDTADANGEAGKKKEDAKKAPQLIHVTTSGLVYMQKLGTAATDQKIDFEYNGMTGHAVGADYDSDTGVLVLHAAVNVSGIQHGEPVLLTASRAEMNRATRQITLAQAKYVTVNDQEGGRSRQTVEAQRAVVLMRPDGSAERMNDEGGVTVTSGDGSQMVADRGEVLLNADNKPQWMHMSGGVHYTTADDARQATGEAREARVAFDKQGHAQHVVLTDAVHMHERVFANAVKSSASERELTASNVEMELGTDAKGSAWLKDAKATGDARLKVTEPGKDGKGQHVNSMKGDVLTAHMVLEGGRPALKIVDGNGATMLEQRGEDGLVQASSGDSLHATFQASPAPTIAAAGKQVSAGTRDEIDTVVQQGHVIAIRMVPAKASQAAETDRATAEKAVYEGASQRMTLTGTAEIESPDGTVWADRVVTNQKTGDMQATGSVKASYRQSGQENTVHVLADRADVKKASNTAIFHGSTGRSARLWQNGSQIEAPVLIFEQKQKRLTARGEGEGAAMAVHTVLVSVGSQGGNHSSKNDAQTPKSDTQHGNDALRRPAVVRIGSREMVYSDDARTALFSGGVKVESADGVMRGQEATAYLQAATAPAAAKKQPAAGSDFMGGAVERVVVNGAIEIDQMARRAVGDRLVYTASDGVFVLTGTDSQPPKVMDAVQGTVTGRELRFRQQDESVVVSNGDATGTGLRVRTETRVKKER